MKKSRFLSGLGIFLISFLSSCCFEGLEGFGGSGGNSTYELGDGSGSNGSNEEVVCAVDFTEENVKWHYNIGTSSTIEVLGEFADVLIIANWSSHGPINLSGLDKSTGKLIWSNNQLITAGANSPNAFISNGDVLIYSRTEAARLNIETGVIVEEFTVPFASSSMLFHENEYYVVSDCCDENYALGIYHWSSTGLEKFELSMPLSQWQGHGLQLSSMALSTFNAVRPTLIIGATWWADNTSISQIFAFDLNSNGRVWSDERTGSEYGFGRDLGYTVNEDRLIVGRRNALTAILIHNGKTIWETEFDQSGFYDGQPFFHDDRIYMYDNYSNENYCFDRHDGRVIWQYTPELAAPIYFHRGNLIWSAVKEDRGLAIIDSGNPGSRLSGPFKDCENAVLHFIPGAEVTTNIIVLKSNNDLVGLQY